MSKDKGGPAFPVDHASKRSQYDGEFGQGMSLLDYFAAKAFQIRLAQAEDRGWTLTEVCEQSWADAAAMLRTRK